MNLKNVAHILKLKLSQNKLAGLYLIRNDENTEGLKKLATLFAKELINAHSINHPDVLFLELDENESSYKVDSPKIEMLTKFINFKPNNSKRKLIFINDAHLISEVLYNKLLKTFEELPDYATIFLKLPRNNDILPTIKSRSIELLINSENNFEEIKNFNLDFTQIMSDLKKENITEDEFLAEVLKNNTSLSYKELSELIETLQQYNKAHVFNNSKGSRVASLLP